MVLSIIVIKDYRGRKAAGSDGGAGTIAASSSGSAASGSAGPVSSDSGAETAGTETGDPETVLPPEPEYVFEPHAVDSTEPSVYVDFTGIQVNNAELEDLSDYSSPYEPISFDKGKDYTGVKGIVTFRGDNFRSGASYGRTQALSGRKFGSGWEISTGTLTDYNGNVWTGSGWTGQPLVARWPKSTRAVMTSMYDWAREQDDLVEVIYATMDGKVYFLELSTGKATRRPLNMGITYKGGGALDPRGYPILYLGGGVRNMDGRCNVSIVNLIDCTVMYKFGDGDPYALRDWRMFDSSAIVDAETDQLIQPGENGLVYIIHLNTQYDEAAGTLSINPDNVVKWRYHNRRWTGNYNTPGKYWLGMESSCVAYGGYLYLNDNGGLLMCLDLNTLELVWVQDILDDSNCSPVMDLENGHPYLYVSTSYHYGWRSSGKETVPVWKIDAETGEIIWRVDFTCYSESGVSGGVQGTLAIDDTSIYVPVARTGSSANAGLLVSLDKKTGETNWEYSTNIYSWGSPIRFDDSVGKKYLIYNTGYSSTGYVYLMNAETGEVYDSRNLNGNVEASGIVFENWLVIGHRSCRIYGIPLT
ncbi:MAG: PQQ-like beta-propeller repeat protein [Oscillospiraceae bacterium]|nr:PQQ-like beta-propeller repeat protein [Oscillospiraceae bacterium]